MDSPQGFSLQLSKMSLFYQMAIVVVIFIFFFVGWLIIRRPSLKDWATGWFFDLIALCFAFIASLPGASLEKITLFYFLYAIFKLVFILFLLQGMYRLRQSFNLNKIMKYYIGFFSGAILAFLYPLLSLQPVHLQALGYFTIGIASITGGIYYLKRKNKKERVLYILSIAFIVYGMVFLNHGFLTLPVFWKISIPEYMNYMSFVDAIVELSLGIALFLVTQVSTLREIRMVNKQLEESGNKLSLLVDVDPLTGVYNRRRLRGYVDSLDEGHLIFVDIDRFKAINDTLGHQMGDNCLIFLANSLRNIFRNEDGLFRFGGDEFLLIVPEMEKEAILLRIEKLQETLKDPPYWCVPFSISVGISPFGKEVSFSTALDIADKMMYKNKPK